MQLLIVWVRSFNEPDLFDNNVPFNNTTLIYVINLLSKLGLGLGLDLRVALLQHFSRRITKTSTLSSANFTEGNILLKEYTQTINNKIKLHILGVSMNKLGNWLMVGVRLRVKFKVNITIRINATSSSSFDFQTTVP